MPVSPVRLLDTRSGLGTQGVKGRVGQNTILLNVSGVTGNPSVQPTAVVLNVTVISPTHGTFVSVYGNGNGPVASSNLNAAAGETIANQVTVQVGIDGDVAFCNADGQVDLIADLAGYYTLDVGGEVVIRQFGASRDTYVGQPLQVDFDLTGNAFNEATFVSGTAASSTYTYTFGVPQYAGAASMTWGVSLIAIFDAPGSQQAVWSGSALSALSPTFTATELVSTMTPNFQGLTLTTSQNVPYVYDGTQGFAQYNIDVQDSQSGVWEGELTLTGPGGITQTTPFGAYADPSDVQTSPCQGDDQTLTDEQQFCTPEVSLPGDAPAGTWAVTSISLTNNAGQTQNFTGHDLVPITVTSDSVVKATAFKATPAQVNNWRSNATASISMDITGSQGGVSSIQLFTSGTGSFCTQPSTTPTHNANGSYSVPLTIDQIIQNGTTCSVDGIAITDGAGDLSLYGIDFTPTNTGVEVTNVPDTTPPVATAASMSVTSIAQSQLETLGNTVFANVQTEILMAPTDGFSTAVFDSSGTNMAGEAGGISVGASGQVQLGLGLPSTLPVGTYTVAFSLTDAGGLTTSYGGPGQNPVPGGPLTFMVTSG